MVKNRKSYKPSYKAQVVLDLLKEEKTLAQIASEYKLSTSVVSRGSEREAAVYCNLAGNLLHDSTQDTKNSRFIILN